MTLKEILVSFKKQKKVISPRQSLVLSAIFEELEKQKKLPQTKINEAIREFKKQKDTSQKKEEEKIDKIQELTQQIVKQIPKKEIKEVIKKIKIVPEKAEEELKKVKEEAQEKEKVVLEKLAKIEVPEEIIKPGKEEKPKTITIEEFNNFIKNLFEILLENTFSVKLEKNPIEVRDERLYDILAKISLGGSGGGPTIISIQGARKTIVDNLSMPTANTVYSYIIPDNTIEMDIKLRTQGYDLLYSWSSDFSNYMTIPAGGSRHFTNVRLIGKKIFFKSPEANQVVEIECLVEI